LSPAGRERAVEEAGAALRQIHGVPAGGFYRRHDDGTWDFPDALAIGRAARRDREGETPLLLQAGFSQNDVQTLLEMLNDPDEHATGLDPVLCHGDFGPAHVLAGDDGAVRGVIDFGEFQGGLPLVDVAYFAMEWPAAKANLSWLRRGYGPAPWWDDHAFPRQLLRHKAGLQMGYVAYYLQQNNREEAEPAARGLRETLEAWRRAL
jgi:aminoglycoside phosphotransferase (APT) family kinase protein